MEKKKIDLTKYKKMVADGLWEIVKNEKGIAVKCKQFDLDTGLEINPTYVYLNVEEIKLVKNTATKSVTNLSQLLVDINVLV